MIRVVDAIMGSGKTEAAIAFINQNPQGPYLYITPYLSEAQRVKVSCPEAYMVTPKPGVSTYKDGMKNKSSHLYELLQNKRNVVTTHAMFLKRPHEIIELVKDGGYTVIIDQALDVFTKQKVSSADIQIMKDAGHLEQGKDQSMHRTDKPYEGGRLSPVFEIAGANDILRTVVESRDKKTSIYFWASSCHAIAEAKQVYILTYMFPYQDLRYYCDVHHIEYEYIGVRQTKAGAYQFCSLKDSTIPEYVNHLKELITIFADDASDKDSRYFNNYCYDGRSGKQPENFLSSTFCQKRHDILKTDMRDRLIRYFCTRFKTMPSSVKAWAAYQNAGDDDFAYDDNYSNVSANGRAKGARQCLSHQSYRKHFIPFNMRASNAYSKKTILAYVVNVYPHPTKVNYIQSQGVEYNQDGYALSVMVQWIWRSAIRNGQPITIWVPSVRMRRILKEWLEHPYIAKERLEGGDEK